jgi:hypothetical protein
METKTNWKKYIGKHIIVRESYWGRKNIEAKVVEVSPAGRVKFAFNDAYSNWEENNAYTYMETLEPATPTQAEQGGA